MADREYRNLTLITLFFSLSVVFLQLAAAYNIILTDLLRSFYSISSNLFIIYNSIVIILISFSYRHKLNFFIIYLNKVLKDLFNIIIIESIVIFLGNLSITKEIDIIMFVKFVFSLFIITYFVSLVFFLVAVLPKYRWIWVVCFVGTIALSPLLVETMTYTRGLWPSSVMEFWNYLVPFQVIDQSQRFVRLEGWQGMDLLLINLTHLLLYWFLIVSICLYVRQFKADWRAT